MRLLSDDEVFGAKELSDADVFGAVEMSDAEVFGEEPKTPQLKPVGVLGNVKNFFRPDVSVMDKFVLPDPAEQPAQIAGVPFSQQGENILRAGAEAGLTPGPGETGAVARGLRTMSQQPNLSGQMARAARTPLPQVKTIDGPVTKWMGAPETGGEPGAATRGMASLIQHSLGLAGSFGTIPEIIGRIPGALGDITDNHGKTITGRAPPARGAFGPEEPTWQDKARSIGQGMSRPMVSTVADWQRHLLEQRSVIGETLRYNKGVSDQANKATLDIINERDFAGLRELLSDPANMAQFTAAAIPSLIAMAAMGGTLGSAMLVEGLGGADTAIRHEMEKGQMPDGTFLSAVALTSMAGILEKYGFDQIRGVKGALGIPVSGVKEFGTEVPQEYIANLTERGLYNPDKNIHEGVLEAGLGGFGAGTTLSAPGGIAGEYRKIQMGGADPTGGLRDLADLINTEFSSPTQQEITGQFNAGRVAGMNQGVDIGQAPTAPPVTAPARQQAHQGMPIEPMQQGMPVKPALRAHAGDLKGRTLQETLARIPEETRAVSPNPMVTLAGVPFSAEKLDAPGPGFLPAKQGDAKANQQLREAMVMSVLESGLPPDVAAKIKVPGADVWDRAFSLPDRVRYWYETSAEGFSGGHVQLPADKTEILIDIVAASSGNKRPSDNVRDAIAAMAQDLQGLPVTVGFRDERSIGKALSDDEIDTHKFANFAGTMQMVAGTRQGKPLPTIDLQMAKMFGLKPEDVANNPVLYETLARYMIKLRDMQNRLLPAGAQPYESWQAQALGWVDQRGPANPDDYGSAMPAIIEKLKAAGIPVPGDKITMETLTDPRTPQVLAPTSKIAEGRIGTIETRTMMTPEGKRTADVYESLKDRREPWAGKARSQFERIQRRAMAAVGNKRPHPQGLDTKIPSLTANLFSLVTGNSLSSWDVSRVGFNGYGTFEGDASPNMRIPMVLSPRGGHNDRVTLDDKQIKQVLAVMGRAFNQAAMASSSFESVALGKHDTFTVFVRRHDGADVDPAMLAQIEMAVGWPVNFQAVANGWAIDINKYDPSTPPLDERNIADKLSPLLEGEDFNLIPRAYSSVFIEANEYDGIIKELENGVQGRSNAGRSRAAWGGEEQHRALLAVFQGLDQVAAEQEAAFTKWADDAQARIEKVGKKKGLPLQALEVAGTFGPETGTLGIPRANMPQIKVKMRPSFIKAMGRHGVTREVVAADSLKPSQIDFDTDKTDRAAGLTDDNTDRAAVIVSNDGYVLDGHHRWLARAKAGKPVGTIRIDLPIVKLLVAARNFSDAHQHLEKRENFKPPSTAEFMPAQTLAKAKEYIASLPADVPKKQFSETDLKKAAGMAEPLVAKASTQNAAFIDRVFDIGESSGALGVMIGPIKKADRVAEKLVDQDEAGWDSKKIRDIIRATVVISSYADAQSVLDEIGKRFEVVPGRVKNRTSETLSHPELDTKRQGPLPSGYADVLVNVMIGGVQAEIQINVPEMIAARLAEGHKLYEIERSLPMNHGMKMAVVEAQSDLYSAASEAAARRASSEELNGSDLGSAPSRNPPEAGSAQNTERSGKTTNSLPGSDWKNRQPGGNVAGTFMDTTSLYGSVAQTGSGMQMSPVEQRAGEDVEAWFNEVESNLRDEDGSPMRLYHGTTKSFDTFKTSKTGAMGGPAVYLGDNPETANAYAGDGAGARVVPVFARGKYLSNTAWSKLVGAHGWDGARIEAQRQGYAGIWDQKFESAVAVWDPANIISTTAVPARLDAAQDSAAQSAWLTEQAAKRGFDSVDQMLAEDMPAFFQLAEQWRTAHPADVLQVQGLYGPYAIQPTKNAGILDKRAAQPKLDERTMQRRTIQPLEGGQFATLNSALADLARDGLPKSWMDGVTYYGLKPVGAGYAHYNPADGSIAVITNHLDAAVDSVIAQTNIRGWLAHELHHRVDNYRNSPDAMFYFSDESPRMELSISPRGKFNIEGDLMQEAFDLWDTGPLAAYLNYPFQTAQQMADDPGRPRGQAESFTKIEVFAQMGALWATNPDLVTQHAPKWAQLFKELHNNETNSIAGSRLRLRALLQKSDTATGVAGLGGRQDQRAAAGGQNQRSLAVSAARPGVGPVRATGGQRGAASRLLTAAEQARASGFLSRPTAPLPGDHEPTHFNYSVTLPAKDFRTISTPEELMGTLARQSELNEEAIQKQRRGTVSWDSTYKEAEGIYADMMGISGKTAANLLKRRPGTPAGAAELIARRDLAITAADDLRRAAAKMRSTGGVDEKTNFMAALDRAAMVHSMFLGARAEAGRALNILRNTKRLSDQAQAIQELVTQYHGTEGLLEIAEMLGKIENPADALKFAKQVSQPDMMDAVIELWKNILLSGPTTHLANVVGNTVFTGLRVPQAFVAGLYGKMHISDRDKVYLGESVAMAYGMVAGVQDGMKLAVETFKNPERDPTSKAEHHQAAFTGRTFHAKGRLGRAIDMVGAGVRVPFRLLGTADGLFRGINASMSIHSGALRQALKEGRHYWDKDFAHRVAQLVSEARIALFDPSAKVSQEAVAIAEEGVRDGLTYTFNENLGSFGRALMKLRGSARATTFIVPFLRTPLNIFRKSIEMTPAAPLSKQWRDEVKAGGHRRDTALAQVTVGVGMGMWAVGMVMQGLLTGGGEPEREARLRRREAGIPNYAMKIGDTWYEFRRLEPVGTVLGMAADAGEIWDYMTQEEQEHAAKMISMAFAQGVTSKTFWRGISDLVNALGDPERYGEAWAQGFAGSIVPGAVSQYNDNFGDRLVRDRGVYGGDMTGYEKQIAALRSAVMVRIPKTGLTPEFNSESLPAKRDVWGKPIEKAERLFPYAPVTIGKTTDDPVRMEVYNLRADLGMPAKKVMDAKLTPEEYWDGFVGPSGELSHRVVSAIIATPQWGSLPAATRAEFIKDAVTEVRGAYRDRMIPVVINRIKAEIERTANAKPHQPRAR